MKIRLQYAVVLLILGGAFLLNAPHLAADQTSDLKNKIQEYETKLKQLKTEKDTLASQIEYMKTQEHITTLQIEKTEKKIEKTEKEINVLGARISRLDSSLDSLSKTLIERITASYKNREVSLLDIVIDSANASMLTNRLKYYQIARARNKKALLQVQGAKTNFEEQKDLREKKIEELDTLKLSLDVQKDSLKAQQAAKANLLAITQNDENKYQQLLAQAKAEFAAIQNIVSGAGTEKKLHVVSKGDVIASIIPTASCNSNGPHVHFIVQEGGSVIDPFTKLKPIDHINDSNGDTFNPSGSWDWPISPQIALHQGYGVTWFVRTYGWYSFHNGIDISGPSDSVYAVSDGTLYSGSYTGFNGCALPYVKVVHKDSNITTLYLHVYAQ